MRQHTHTRSLSMLSLALVSLGVGRPAVAAPPTGEQLVSEVDALAARRLQAPGAAGLSVAVARDGEIVLAKGYGLAEVEHGVAADADTMFRIGSVTKQFTAAAIMRLVEAGKLSLDDDMAKYLPDFPTQGHTVTIRHLLTHTSGIKSYTGVREFWETGAARELSVDELLAYVKDIDFDFAPGEQYKYNNTGYYILGAIVEEASGTPYCRFLLDEFFTPLDLARTRCDSNADIIPNRAQGYGVDNGKLVNDGLIGMNNPGAAGMILSTARDLVAWGTALFDGEVVSAESLEQMTTPGVLPSGESTGYGFGLSMGEQLDRRVIAHGGGIFGFSAMLTYFPDDELFVAVNSNVSGGLNAGTVARDVASAVFGDADSLADLALNEEDLARFSGTYVLERVGLEAKIFEQDGYLFLQPSGQSTARLLYQGKGEFRAQDVPSVKIVFDIESGRDFTLHQNGQQVKGVRQP